MSRIMHRPAPWIVPGFALEALIGEFAKSGILGGQRAIPSALENAGFTFRHNTIGEALAAALN
jgi:NAD dependent epimerase/dehydratase family enzyme